jgi:hypothetical protein
MNGSVMKLWGAWILTCTECESQNLNPNDRGEILDENLNTGGQKGKLTKKVLLK